MFSKQKNICNGCTFNELQESILEPKDLQTWKGRTVVAIDFLGALEHGNEPALGLRNTNDRLCRCVERCPPFCRGPCFRDIWVRRQNKAAYLYMYIYIYKQIVQGEERRCSLTRKISFAAVAILSLCIYGPSQARPLVSWLNLISNSLFPERWSLATCRQRKEKTTRAAIIQALPGSLSWRWSCLRRRHRRRLGKDRVETLPSRHRCSCHPWS